MSYTNTDKGLSIARIVKIELPQKWGVRVIQNREIQKKLISKWKRRKGETYCGQYTSDCFIQAGYDMSPFLNGKSLWNINTSMQYANALKNKVKEVTPEQAFYLACVGRPVLVLSPESMIVDGKKYNHAAITWPVFHGVYDPSRGPAISQQGWSPLCPGWVSGSAAWGKAWKHGMVKYFLPVLK